MSSHNRNGNYQCQRLTPLGASRKRKERDGLDSPRVLKTTKAEQATASAAAAAAPSLPQPQPQPQPASGSNRLLAGYLAHEFLTKGTLFGQCWDPAAAAATLPPAGARPRESKEPPPTPKQQQKSPETKAKAYADVACILKTDEAHIPGIVNPTQLARWLQM